VAGPIVNPLYVAPEQTDPNTRLDGRADIYSLGAILYHGLTGEPPFQARQLFDLQRAHHEAPIPDPRRLVPDLPAELTYLIQCCLAKDRAKRLDAEGLEERIGDLMVELKVERHSALAQETIIRSVPEVAGLQSLAEGAAEGPRPVAPGIAAALATVTSPTRVEASPRPTPEVKPLDQGHDGDWLVLTGPGGRCLTSWPGPPPSSVACRKPPAT
jgi:serine/threonine-protein kinase